MCGVTMVAISLVDGTTSVVETGMTNGEGASVTGSDEKVSGESRLAEHAPRSKVQKRSVRKVFCIRSSKLPNPCTRILVFHLVDGIFPRNVPNAECQLYDDSIS